jgi:hypothetical protein
MRKILSMLVLCALSWTAAAADPPSWPTFTYGWSPSPVVDDQGQPLAPAEYYEVWLQCDGGPAVKVATVADDTTWTLVPDTPAEYRLHVVAVDSLGRSSEPSPWSDPLVVPRVTDAPPAAAMALQPPFPNPFNPRTTLRYTVPADLPAGAAVSLEILDARGARVCRLATRREAGSHTAVWRGRDDAGQTVSSGTYLARLRCEGESEVVRLTLIK